jgi:hypothetical protein
LVGQALLLFLEALGGEFLFLLKTFLFFRFFELDFSLCSALVGLLAFFCNFISFAL